jgi:hypothetical protein
LYWCENNLLSNDFKNNSALNGSGGALFFDFNRHINLQKNIFSGNIASDWNDFNRPLSKLVPLEKDIKVHSGLLNSF